MAPGPPPAPPPIPLQLLPFKEPLSRLSSKPLDLMQPLVGRKDIDTAYSALLQVQRAMVLTTLLQADACAVTPSLLQSFHTFINNMNGLAQHVHELAPSFKPEWTSALGGPTGAPQNARVYQLTGLSQEVAMMYSAYAAAVRQAGLQSAVEMTINHQSTATGANGSSHASGGGSSATGSLSPTGNNSGGGGGVDSEAVASAATAAATALRQAAGIYMYLAEDLLPRLGVVDNNRPLELHAPTARCMSQHCLAEAQAVIAWRATAKGCSPATAAGLHAGAAELFQKAVLTAELFPGLGYSLGWSQTERWVKLLQASGHLHAARAMASMARDRKAADEMGAAEKYCQSSQHSINQALNYCRNEAIWKDICTSESAQLKLLEADVSSLRLKIYYQPLPAATPDLPLAKVLVAAIPYVPAPVPPPAPGPVPQHENNGCIIC